MRDNPAPSDDPAFKCINCAITLHARNNNLTFSQHDIDNYLIEEILLNGQ